MILKHAESVTGSRLIRDTEKLRWQVEGPQGTRTVKLGEAITIAADWRAEGGSVTTGIVGGQRFDSGYENERVRRLRDERAAATVAA